MDPTKSFDHLDPKLKETYARVMATGTNNANNTPNTAGISPIPLPDPGLSPTPTPTSFDPSQLSTDASQLSSSPTPPDQTTNLTSDTGPNPGTGPSVTTIPTGANSMFSPPADTQTSAPPTSSFFSNPSPASTDPSQAANADMSSAAAPIEPPAEPATVTPYAPEGVNGNPVGTDQYSQPLPSPSMVNQSVPHETSALLKVLYIVGAVIFFAVYTVFWIKVFNLPFLF